MNTNTLIVGLISAVACMASLPSLAAPATWTNPDLYGHVAFDPPQSTTDATREPGEGDMYGSVLLDPVSKATTDAFANRGEAPIERDKWYPYVSLLLDDVVAGKSVSATGA